MGLTGNSIRTSLERENDQMKARVMVRGLDSLKPGQKLPPAMGMIGTLVGLVLMLGNMSDPKAISS